MRIQDGDHMDARAINMLTAAMRMMIISKKSDEWWASEINMPATAMSMEVFERGASVPN